MDRAKRKISHIQEVIKQGSTTLNSFDEMEVIHQSLTTLDWDKLSLQIQCGELTLSSPLFINAMTGGGGNKTEEINRNLAMAAHEKNIAMAVGSQMSALKDSEEKKTYEVVRKENPNGVVIANIGSEASVDHAMRAIDMLEANALQVHVNVMQELIMPEGDRDFSSRLQNMENILKEVSVPVIVKEVGFGISKETTQTLKSIGVHYIDVGGKGGTSFSEIENNRRKERLSAFDTWGIPTVVSLKEVLSEFQDVNLIASGGIRNGLDGVKAMIIGARMFGMAGPMIRTLMEDGYEQLLGKIDMIHDEIKIAMLTLGMDKPEQLPEAKYVLYGRTREWVEQRVK